MRKCVRRKQVAEIVWNMWIWDRTHRQNRKSQEKIRKTHNRDCQSSPSRQWFENGFDPREESRTEVWPTERDNKCDCGQRQFNDDWQNPVRLSRRIHIGKSSFTISIHHVTRTSE
jgi:hypothetical protein